MFINKVNSTFVGNYSIYTKEKETYYIIQCLVYSETEEEANKGIRKANLVRVFVPLETYKKFSSISVGSEIELEMSFSLETGKVYYKVVE